ncbi:hypothetical protein DFH05DRAFT_399692 [Lentinula detonsa]|uniref:Secreted protein n=1 Tax=Lentinula detonsa TaxID=2804962 RepID=A0A9W8TU48_9AGAR|nr:hypothetical protein DFH05DRAFT_399692 [Lentinula detonsa]
MQTLWGPFLRLLGLHLAFIKETMPLEPSFFVQVIKQIGTSYRLSLHFEVHRLLPRFSFPKPRAIVLSGSEECFRYAFLPHQVRRHLWSAVQRFFEEELLQSGTFPSTQLRGPLRERRDHHL